jgi:hypothetical protein
VTGNLLTIILLRVLFRVGCIASRTGTPSRNAVRAGLPYASLMRRFRKSRMQTIIAVVAIMLIPMPSGAQWKDMRAPSKSDVLSLAASGDAFLAGTYEGDVFRSANGGLDWEKAKLPQGYPVLSLAAYGGTGDTVFAVRSQFYYPLADCFSFECMQHGSQDVAESRNGGRDWSASGFHGATALAMEKDGSLWAFNRDSVFRRERGATEITGRPFDFPADGTRKDRNCRSAAVVSGYLYALLDGQLYKAPAVPAADTMRFTRVVGPAGGMYPDSAGIIASTSGGLLTWAPDGTPRGLAPQPLLGWLGRGASGLLALARDSLTVYRSVDHAYHWTAAAPALPKKAQAVAEAGGNLAAALADGSVWISARGGAWRRSEAGPAETPVLPLLVSEGNVWAQIHDRGIAHAPIGGGEWLRDTLPIGNGSYPPLLASTQSAFWVGSAAGLWRRKSGATAWDSVLGEEVTALAVSGNRIVAAVERGPVAASGHFLEFCEGDGPCRETPPGLFGNTRGYYSPFTGLKIGSLRMAFLIASGDTVLAADSLFYRSRDGGNTWDTVFEAGYSPASTLAWSRGSLYRLARGAPGCDPCLERSSDLGSSWETLPFMAPEKTYARAQLATDGTGLFLLTDKGLLQSGDGRLWSGIWEGRGLPVALAAGAGYAAVADDENKLWSLALPPAPVGLRAPRGPIRERPGAARRFRDRLGRPRLADGSALR